MIDGTAMLRFRTAFIDKLQTRVSNVSYQSPMQESDVLGADGTGLACWWSDEANSTGGVNVIVSDDEVWYDETFTTTLNIQALGLTTDDTQELLDQRANEVLGEAIRLLSIQSSLDITDDEIQTFTWLLQGWTYMGGVQQGTGQRVARFELAIEGEARLKLGSTS